MGLSLLVAANTCVTKMQEYWKACCILIGTPKSIYNINDVVHFELNRVLTSFNVLLGLLLIDYKGLILVVAWYCTQSLWVIAYFIYQVFHSLYYSFYSNS